VQSPMYLYLQYDVKTERRVVVKKLKFVKMLYVPCVLVWALRGSQVHTVCTSYHCKSVCTGLCTQR
jgi:hypothetical protein